MELRPSGSADGQETPFSFTCLRLSLTQLSWRRNEILRTWQPERRNRVTTDIWNNDTTLSCLSLVRRYATISLTSRFSQIRTQSSPRDDVISFEFDQRPG
jgi:hypothetical protein